MSAVAVNGLVGEAIEYGVSTVAATRPPRSAKPNASLQTISPLRATATAIDGVAPSAMIFRIFVRSAPTLRCGRWLGARTDAHASSKRWYRPHGDLPCPPP
jgi:hypothetical protein